MIWYDKIAEIIIYVVGAVLLLGGALLCFALLGLPAEMEKDWAARKIKEINEYKKQNDELKRQLKAFQK